MTARDDLKSEINAYFSSYVGESLTTEFDDLLDAFAMETIRKAAVSMRRSWRAGHFSVHETDGVMEAMEYLINLTSDKGEIRTGVIGRDFMTWLTDSSDA